MKKIVLGILLLASMCVAVQASYPISAFVNAVTGAGLYDTGITLAPGSQLSITNNWYDTWTIGYYSEECDANGTDPFGSNFGTWTNAGQTFLLGSMVGRIGNNPYFLVGTSFSQTVFQSGKLFLGCWDSTYIDNSGWIMASITSTIPVGMPLPAAVPALFLGSVMSSMFVRKRKFQ